MGIYYSIPTVVCIIVYYLLSKRDSVQGIRERDFLRIKHRTFLKSKEFRLVIISIINSTFTRLIY